jgi:3-oxocholest-4-en-26-oate---CoA ligase
LDARFGADSSIRHRNGGGQAVVGLVEPNRGATASEDDLRQHVRARLAGFKTPKRVLFVDSIGRAPNGKADYVAMTRLAEQRLADG